MRVYESESYQDFVKHCLDEGTAHRPKSTKRGLADHLKCHSTYISHVLSDKAHFSVEQAVRFADYFGLDRSETEFFVDLLSRDRAGDTATRSLFDGRLSQRRDEWLTVSGRLHSERRLSEKDEARLFETWTLQAVHLACMLTDVENEADVARRLGLDLNLVKAALLELTTMGMVEVSDKGSLRPVQRRLHLDRLSPNFRRYHANWRFKTVTDVSMGPRAEDIHYTSLVTISAACALEVKKLILDHIETARSETVASDPEELYVHAVDFYRLSREWE